MSSETIIISLVVAVIVAILGFSIFQKIRQKKEQWTGVVIDKGYNEQIIRDATTRTGSSRRSGTNISIGGIGGINVGNQNRSGHVSISYYIVAKTEEGKEIKRTVSEGFYEIVNIGDKIAKQSGTRTPEIIEKKTQPDSQQGSPDGSA